MSKFSLLVASLLIAGSAAATEIPLNNADFEKPMVGKRIPGWSVTQHAGLGAYVTSTDSKVAAHGKSSISMRRTTEQVYGLIMQRVQGKDLGSKEIELSAMLKTAEVGPQGWVMVMTFKNYGNILDQIRATPVAGDTAWKEVVLKKVAPASTNTIELGFLLMDGGTGWADHVRLRTIDQEDKESAAKKSAAKEKSGSADKQKPVASKDSKKSAKPEPAATKTGNKDAKLKSSVPQNDKKAG